jgi:hypothetical protein
MDTAGRGAAAAQQFRQNEHQMDVVDERTRNEVNLAARKLDIEESNITFEREQLARQQEAAADVIVKEKLRLGQEVTPELERALRGLSPRAQETVLDGVARDGRLKAQQATIGQAMSKLDELESTGNVDDEIAELRAQAEAGAITPQQLVSGVAALGKKSATIDHAAKGYEVIQKNMEAWVDPKTNPEFDMPAEDDEAYDDVMELYALLTPNAPFDPKVKYHEVWNQYKFLTTRGMREASRALLEADMKKNGVTTINVDDLDDLLASASKKPEFQARAQGLYGATQERVDRVAGPRFKRSRPGAAEQSAPASGGAPTDGAKSTAPAPSGGEGRDLGALGRSLTPEADRLKPEEESIGNQAMKNLGLTHVPDEGTPEFKLFLREIKRLEDEAYAKPVDIGAAVKSAREARPGLGEYIGRGVRAAAEAITPSEEQRRRNVSSTKRNRGVR